MQEHCRIKTHLERGSISSQVDSDPTSEPPTLLRDQQGKGDHYRAL